MRVSNAPLYGPSAFTLTATSTMEFEAGGRAATGPAAMPSASAPAATVAMRRRFTGVLLGRTLGSGGPGAWTRSDRWVHRSPGGGTPGASVSFPLRGTTAHGLPGGGRTRMASMPGAWNAHGM